MKNYVKLHKFQAGGEMPMGEAPMEGAPVAPEQGMEQAPQAGGEDQMMQAINQILESQDCNMAMQFIQMLAESMQGQGQPTAEEAPVFKKGGKMYKKGGKKVMMNGGKMKAKNMAKKMVEQKMSK